MHVSRKHRIPVVAVTALGLVAAAGVTTMAIGGSGSSQPSAAQQLAALSGGSQSSYIVVLKNQHPELSAKTAKAQRKQAADADQSALVGHAKSTGAKDVKPYSLINGFAAKMTPAEAAHLAADPKVLSVVPDKQVAVAPLTKAAKDQIKAAANGGLAPLAAPTTTAAAPASTSKATTTKPTTTKAAAGSPVIPGTCPTDPSKPILEPEALQDTHTAYTDPNTPQAQNIATGKGVKVAWIADGIDPNNQDFIRADGTPVFTDYQDFSGTDPNGPETGGEAFGDASSIAAQGLHSYDLSKWVNAANPLPAGCTITVRGVAPGASLVGLNIFGSAESSSDSVIIQAIDYAVNVANVDVINESIGSNTLPTEAMDLTSLADDAAVAAGVTVVASTGDAGPTGTNSQPANDPNVIGVAASVNSRLRAQTGYAGARKFGTSWANDDLSSFSSGGVDAKGRVPDMTAPGNDGWAVCSDSGRFSSCNDGNASPSAVYDFGGTSESAPFVSGGAALVIEAYKSTHNGVRPTPALVKQILTSTATDLGLPAYQQGAGQLNTLAAVKMAQSIKDANGAPAAQGGGLLLSIPAGDTQLSMIGDGGSSQTQTVEVTNTSPNTQTVTAHGRLLSTKVGETKDTVNVAFNDPASPTFVDGFSNAPGVPRVRSYKEMTFKVPAGADHLSGQFSWAGGSAATGDSAVRLTLIDPNGAFHLTSDPQGIAHYGQVDLAYPAAGTWTAVWMGNAAASSYHGPIQYDFTSTRYADFGSVSPAGATIAPGATAKFTVKGKLPSDAGDLSAAVEFDTALKGKATMPWTLRTLISPKNDKGEFTGALLGGNGRGSLADATSYYFDVPKGKKNLSVDLTLAGAIPGHQLIVTLENPSHQVQSTSTNIVGDGSVASALQAWADQPAAGRWGLTITDLTPSAGTAISQKYTGHLKFDAVDAKTSGLPSGKVPAGKPITATITVKNNGAAAETFFADPRLTGSATYPLLVQAPSDGTVPLPTPAGTPPASWEIPTHSTALQVDSSATVGVDFALSSSNGTPEYYGAPHGLTAEALAVSSPLSQGLWSASPTFVGPTNAAVNTTVKFDAQITTQPFDKAAVASTGDFWLAAVDANAPALNGITLQPGQSGKITVVITPSGKAGSKVNGVIYINDFAAALGSGDELIGLPYSYTVK